MVRYAAVASAAFVTSLHCEISEAADPGFYVGAAGARSEQRLDKAAGVAAVPVVLTQPPSITPVPRPIPPAFGTDVIFVPIPLIDPETSADEVDVGWNLALGYRVNKYFAAELAYVDGGEASLTQRFRFPASVPTAASAIEMSYRVRTRGPAVSVLGSLPFSERWEAFIRGGVLFASQEVESTTTITGSTGSSAGRRDQDYSDEVVSVGAGLQWAFLPRWTARLEYQRTDDLKSNGSMGESRLDQASLSVLFGL
ncbi:outer membrane beta-barrel protein [Steroidobacter sp. S1-65]|uniref:Outer membrane beta-barrel protein n=1 Tax=Steroidobacter gossypii TaxID=2805490 RepID=A0ABS1X6H1_9GAMM|nr:outer membrane beta-barrel protein [Steroidobacter gossypii]MBM0108822.1 outer membrane beta-barrel protein [Steroidobacter gossypii]